MADPDVACMIPSDGIYESGRHGFYAEKTASAEDGNSVKRSYPKLPQFVLKQQIDCIFRELRGGNLPNRHPRLRRSPGAGSAEWVASASGAHVPPVINRDLALIPSVQ